jgi:hypothetical protein
MPAIITNNKPLPYSTHAFLDKPTLDYLATYIVTSVNGRVLTELQIQMQYEFLTRAAYITLSDWDKFVERRNYIRTRFKNIFKSYVEGDFRRSSIPILKHSGALDFEPINETKQFLYYSISEEIEEWLDANA